METEKSKSVKLQKLTGWYTVEVGKGHYRLSNENGSWLSYKEWASTWASTKERLWLQAPNLYDPMDMALAWEVLNWVVAQHNEASQRFSLWWEDKQLWELPINEAQTMWLDKVLELYEN